VKKSKFVLIVFALALVINIQTFPLFLIFSINTSKISLHNNCIGEEPPITNPELNITEVIYNYKKHIFSETNIANFNVINIDNLNIDVIQENYPDKFNIPLLIIKGKIKYKINSEEEVLKLYINQFEYEIRGESKYGRLFWEKDEKNDDLINFTFYNNGLNNNLKPLIPLKSKDMKPEETVIKIKCKDQAGNESKESTVSVYYSPQIWLKLTVGDTKVGEVKPFGQIEIQRRDKKEPKTEDWKPYQVYDKSTKKLKDYSLDLSPIVENGTTLVPIRFIAEAFGAEVKYDDQIKKIQINFKDKGISIYLYVGKTDCYIRDEKLKTQTKKSLNTPPVIKNGRALVPLRFIAEAFGAEVNWISQTKEIQIKYSTLN